MAQASISIQQLSEAILMGNRFALSKAITLVESTRPDHIEEGGELLNLLLPFTGKSKRIGISGPPGVGKSTLIEGMGKYRIGSGGNIAVLAVDPTSQLSGGSILGDKTRMAELSKHDNAFIRPTPSGGTLGGVGRSTRETILLCEAAGYDLIFVETVGVGQSETAVADMVDCFVLILQAGAGDELQGMKRGIMELADILLVNKADGQQLELARHTRSAYAKSLHLLQARHAGWMPEVLTCSAMDPESIIEAWGKITGFFNHVEEVKSLGDLRSVQNAKWFDKQLNYAIMNWMRQDKNLAERVDGYRSQVIRNKISATSAVTALINLIKPGD